MLSRKRLTIIAILVVLFVASVFVLWEPPSRVTEENYYRIRVGMSRKEVEAIVGPPSRKKSPELSDDTWNERSYDIWKSEEFEMKMVIDKDERVVWVHFQHAAPQPGLLEGARNCIRDVWWRFFR